MAATDCQFSPAFFLARRIFLPMILFGEGFGLHYFYCMT